MTIELTPERLAAIDESSTSSEVALLIKAYAELREQNADYRLLVRAIVQ